MNEEIAKQISDLNLTLQLEKQATGDFRQSLNCQLEELNKKVTTLTHVITGNGTPERGIIVRIDRLEIISSRNKWMARSAIAAIFVAIVTAVATHFFH